MNRVGTQSPYDFEVSVSSKRAAWIRVSPKWENRQLNGISTKEHERNSVTRLSVKSLFANEIYLFILALVIRQQKYR